MADTQPADQTAPTDPAALYAQLSPDQRAAFAQQFITQFQQSGNPQSQQIAASVNPQTATPQQLADMHQHASANHPGLLEGLLNHPVAVAAFAGLATYGTERYFKSKEQPK